MHFVYLYPQYPCDLNTKMNLPSVLLNVLYSKWKNLKQGLDGGISTGTLGHVKTHRQDPQRLRPSVSLFHVLSICFELSAGVSVIAPPHLSSPLFHFLPHQHLFHSPSLLNVSAQSL